MGAAAAKDGADRERDGEAARLGGLAVVSASGDAAVWAGDAAFRTPALCTTGGALPLAGDAALRTTGDTALWTGEAALRTGEAALWTGEAALWAREPALEPEEADLHAVALATGELLLGLDPRAATLRIALWGVPIIGFGTVACPEDFSAGCLQGELFKLAQPLGVIAKPVCPTADVQVS